MSDLNVMRLQYDIAVLIARSEDGKIVIKESEYKELGGKVVECTINPDDRTTTYNLAEYVEEEHGQFNSGEEEHEESPDLVVTDEGQEAMEEFETSTQASAR